MASIDPQDIKQESYDTELNYRVQVEFNENINSNSSSDNESRKRNYEEISLNEVIEVEDRAVGRPKKLDKEYFEWSDELTFMLIDLWGEHEVLYNQQHPNHYSKSENDNALRDIAISIMNASNVQITPKQITLKFQTLKSYFSKERGKLTRTGIMNSRWKFYSSLDFLDKHMAPRLTANKYKNNTTVNNLSIRSIHEGSAIRQQTSAEYQTFDSSNVSSAQPPYSFTKPNYTALQRTTSSPDPHVTSIPSTRYLTQSADTSKYNIQPSTQSFQSSQPSNQPTQSLNIVHQPTSNPTTKVLNTPQLNTQRQPSTQPQAFNASQSPTVQRQTNHPTFSKDEVQRQTNHSTYSKDDVQCQTNHPTYSKDDDDFFGEMIARMMRNVPAGHAKDILKINVQQMVVKATYNTDNS